MTISSALSNALSGLTVASRSADIVSSNIANAMTDGYGVRSVHVSSRVVGNAGAGARVSGIIRHEDTTLLAYRRQADAELNFQSNRNTYLNRLEELIGTPEQPGSLVARVAQFQASLNGAANSPHSQAHLTSAVDSAQALVGQINSISDGIQDQRLAADDKIERTVDVINDRLQKLSDLNNRIRQSQTGGRDTSALKDAQAQLMNDLSPLISMETRRDALGGLQIYTTDGRVLLDARPSVLSFSAAGVMDPHMVDEASGLDQLQLNGSNVAMTGPHSVLGGGELAALFELRDEWGVEAQAQIDAVARDLAERFNGTTLDPTIATGAPGLFTDGGALAEASNEVGLSRRLALNSAVDPSEGGAVWRLRDGLGAATEGAIGNADFLRRQIETMDALNTPASGSFSSARRSFSGLVADHLTDVGFARQTAEIDHTYANSRHAAILEEELGQGVDTDAEMQRLLQVEQMFAANARVVTAAQEMIDELMRMV